MKKLIVLLSLAVSLTAVGHDHKATKEKSLFDRLGGKAAITSVVDQFVANCGGDTRINKYFGHLVADNAKMTAFKGHLVDQVCEATGGPCKYKGRDMKSTHSNYNITEGDFSALVEDLVASLDKHKVPKKEKDELISILATLKGDIVKSETAKATDTKKK